MPSLPKPRGPKATKVDTGRILDAAQDVFAEAGLEGGSIRAIARRAGCDPSLIYYHFESKDALFLALLDRKIPPVAEDLARIAQASDDRPAAERFWEVLQTYRRHFMHDRGFRAVLRGEILRGADHTREAIAQRLRRTSGSVAAIVEQGVARGELRPDLHPHMTAAFLIKLYLELLDHVPAMARLMVGMEPAEALALAERQWFELFWRGVSTRPGSPLPFCSRSDS